MDLNGFKERSFGANLKHVATMAWALGKHRVHQLRFGDRAFLRVLHDAPAVLLIAHHDKNFLPLHQALGAAPGYFIFTFWGTKESPAAIAAIRRLERKKRDRYPHHRYIFLCNTLEELRLIEEAGLTGIFCSNNCWIDEELFRPDPAVAPCYDAVYDANLAAYKRHLLAAEVPNLALISFRHPVMFNGVYARSVRRALAHAHWVNDPLSPEFRYLSTPEVVRTLQLSRVGLCLSASEGAMYASIQYQLCGLPVVSTPSRGGRDVFYDDESVRIVAATPAAVRAGVEELLARRPPAAEIRDRALRKVWEHRGRFQALLQEIYDRHGTGLKVAKEWPRLFRHKLGLGDCSIRRTASQLAAGVPFTGEGQ